MSPRARQAIKWSFRAAELGLAFALLAVLVELVLVIINTPGEFPDIQLFKQHRPEVTGQAPNPPTQFPSAIVSQPAQAPVKTVAPKRVQNPAPPAPAVAPAPAPEPPALLSFRQTRRLVSRFFGSDSTTVSLPATATPAPMVLVPVASYSTVVYSTNRTGSGNAPSNTQTNANNGAGANQSPGTASNPNANSNSNSPPANAGQVARTDPNAPPGSTFRFALP